MEVVKYERKKTLFRKMSLPDQPEEILIEQLRRLPLQDLLNACQTNHRISKVCQGRRLWDFRLMDDFRLYDFSRIPNPRDYYFSLLAMRKAILDRILSTVTQQFYVQNNALFDDPIFDTYQQFADFQRRVVEQLSVEELNAVTFMQTKMSSFLMHHYEKGGSIPQNTLFFYPDFSNDVSGRSYIIMTTIIV
jgi:hypothetical protein